MKNNEEIDLLKKAFLCSGNNFYVGDFNNDFKKVEIGNAC